MARGRYRSADGHAAVRGWCEDRLVGRERTTVGTTSLVTAGSGSPTVVFAPGTNMNAATSLGLLDALAAHRRVVVVDLPGQPGLSAAAPEPWVDEILATIDGPVVLVGHSMGAAALLAATPAPQIVGFVLLCPAGLTKVAMSLGLLRTFVPWLLRPTPSSSTRLVHVVLAPGRDAPPDVVEWFTLVGRHCRSTGAPGPSPVDVVRRWASTPRAVVVGEHDAFFPPAKLAGPAQDLLGVDPVVVHDAGHLLPDEQPRAVVEAILAVGG